MATIGQQLTAPEAGWKRYDDSHVAFIYTGTWTSDAVSTDAYNGKFHMGNSNTQKIKFKFVGTKIRLIAFTGGGQPNATINIDGNIDIYSYALSPSGHQRIVYEKVGLENKEHIVEIQNPSNLEIYFDAIDIDVSGRLLMLDEVTDIKDLSVGKRIRCNYQSLTSGSLGFLSGLGKESKNFIPTSSSATPDGDFYFIMVEDWNGQKRLIADRNIQHSISWDTLNSAGIVSGLIVPSINYTPDLATDTSKVTSNDPNLSDSYGQTVLKAFDGSLDTVANNFYRSTRRPSVNNPIWITYDFTLPEVINVYRVNINLSQHANTWTLQGSNDNSSWTNLHSVDNLSLGIHLFKIQNTTPYRYYRLLVTGMQSTATNMAIIEIDYMREIFNDTLFKVRLLSGGINSSDKDNEWDKYIVKSTLNGTISYGDNNVWNWSQSVQTQVSTRPTVNNSNRITRGSASNIEFWGHTSSSSAVISSGFRPMLIIEPVIKLITKSFILSNGKYNKLIEGISGTPATYSDNQIPKMTSNSTPEGVVTASSIFNAGADAWKAFDKLTTASDLWIASSTTGWIGYQFSTAKRIGKYTIHPPTASMTRSPKTWTLQASNTGSFSGEQVTLDTQTNITGWTEGVKKEFIFSNNNSYLYYRVNITSNSGDASYVSIGEIEMLEIIPAIPATPSYWQTVSETFPSVNTFINEGMNNLSGLDRVDKTIVIPMISQGTLGQGKTFKGTVDLKKYIQLTSVKVK